ncbi:MAG: aminopeptidase P family protein [Burkholderiales bacterium]|nr:aminopeptidase P family protein [Burkholderiales bacterium]
MSEFAATARERIRAPIPTRELERRWSALRTAMRAQGIDLLIAQNDNQYLGGYVRYFTDFPAETAYPVTVLFPADDEMSMISHGGPPKPPGPPAWAVRGVRERLARPYFRTAHYTDGFDAQEAVKVIQRRGDRRIGLVGMGAMGASFYAYLKEHLPGVDMVVASELVDRIKAVKSEDELVFVRQAARTQDLVFAAMPSIVRPGKYEYQVRGEIARMLMDLGSEEQLLRLSSAPAGEPAATMETFLQNRQIRIADQVCILIEPSGPGGFYTEICRTWCLGEPSPDLLRMWEISVAGQKLAASLLEPGVRPGEVFRKVNEFLAGKGQVPEGRTNAHGQGYDLVERPLFCEEETMPLAAGMVVALHPLAANERAFALCCDDYLIRNGAAERLHKTPQDVFVIDC